MKEARNILLLWGNWKHGISVNNSRVSLTFSTSANGQSGVSISQFLHVRVWVFVFFALVKDHLKWAWKVWCEITIFRCSTPKTRLKNRVMETSVGSSVTTCTEPLCSEMSWWTVPTPRPWLMCSPVGEDTLQPPLQSADTCTQSTPGF